ncbi:UDP-glucoronosyl and UDP-glucosyl transferase domain-containing protein [Phthorimaea operculella]|nr:UDP-glucoronosyl and UDP-glucosyl transferase domain-containing protein [Phthorimaea operculella]
MKLLNLCVVLISLFKCEAYKVLVVYPFPAKSHNILGNGVVRHLLKAGHEVTYITPFPIETNDSNLHQVDVSVVRNLLKADILNVSLYMAQAAEINDESSLFTEVFKVAAAVVKTENVQKILNDPTQQFDVIVNEWMFNDLYAGFAAVFNCPYIWTFPYEPYIHILSLIDEAPNPAYTSNLKSSNVPPFNFVQRLEELFSQVKSSILRTYFQIPLEKAVYEEAFGAILKKQGRILPTYDELRHNVSMILGNSHLSVGLPMRVPESYKSIAGYYIDENVETLPEDLQKLMDDAKNGVIYFSLGSNLKSKDFPEIIKKQLITVFSELKEVVLWKFEEQFKNLPKNVHVTKWAPQQSILAHPNCKIFITHGGLLSTTEAAHFGVPIIGVPVFVDQFSNIERAVHRGYAIRVDLTYSLANDLRKAIREITTDYKYTTRAREISSIFHDRLVSPATELVHWVEYVARNHGAHHLRSPALRLPWYQKCYLDLVTILAVVQMRQKNMV